MLVLLTDDTELAGPVSVAETRIIILNYFAKRQKWSEKDETKWGNHHRNTRWGRPSWKMFLPLRIEGLQGITTQVKRSLQNKNHFFATKVGVGIVF